MYEYFRTFQLAVYSFPLVFALAIINEQDVVSFMHSGPTVTQVAALTVPELRLVCDILCVVQAPALRKKLLNVVAKTVSDKAMHG